MHKAKAPRARSAPSKVDLNKQPKSNSAVSEVMGNPSLMGKITEKMSPRTLAKFSFVNTMARTEARRQLPLYLKYDMKHLIHIRSIRDSDKLHPGNMIEVLPHNFSHDMHPESLYLIDTKMNTHNLKYIFPVIRRKESFDTYIVPMELLPLHAIGIIKLVQASKKMSLFNANSLGFEIDGKDVIFDQVSNKFSKWVLVCCENSYMGTYCMIPIAENKLVMKHVHYVKFAVHSDYNKPIFENLVPIQSINGSIAYSDFELYYASQELTLTLPKKFTGKKPEDYSLPLIKLRERSSNSSNSSSESVPYEFEQLEDDKIRLVIFLQKDRKILTLTLKAANKSTKTDLDFVFNNHIQNVRLEDNEIYIDADDKDEEKAVIINVLTGRIVYTFEEHPYEKIFPRSSYSLSISYDIPYKKHTKI
jgi:hypothetical protein